MSGNTSETRCKHCQRRIAFSGNYWLQVETNGYLSGGFCLSNPNGRHEPTPPEVEAVTEQPFSKALTVIMFPDNSDAQADRDVDAVLDKSSTIFRQAQRKRIETVTGFVQHEVEGKS